MTRYLQTLTFVVVLAVPAMSTVRAQDKPAPPAKESTEAKGPIIPLKVQVVISRYQGEKKVSSMPYNLMLNAGNHANLRMGATIPIAVSSGTQYKDVGTNIDCSSTALEDGRFLLAITVDDSSVYPDEQQSGGTKGNPSFRSFRASNSTVLRNAETGQFTTATDKVSGETVKIDVTLTVMK